MVVLFYLNQPQQLQFVLNILPQVYAQYEYPLILNQYQKFDSIEEARSQFNRLIRFKDDQIRWSAIYARQIVQREGDFDQELFQRH